MEKRQVEITRIYEENESSDKLVNLNEGGARSSKSYSILQLLIQRFTSRSKYALLICRKTLPALKLTAYKVFVDLLQNYNYYQFCYHNKSDRIIKFRNNFVYFGSVDVPEKIMSSEFNDIFMEEANEFTFEDFIMLKTRMSGEIAKEDAGAINQMFLSYNPKEPRGYINEKVKLIKDLKLIKSTYRDNPFLTTEYIKTLEDLKEQDESYYKIFTLGEYAEIKGHIYDKYEIIKNFPEADEIIYGLDFGFNHPTALVEVHIRDGNYYIKENLYRTGMTNNELINYLNETLPNKKREIYCDSAEPDRIEELYRKKFNVHKANKSVKDGIDYIKSRKIYIHEESINLIDEFKDYKWKIDTNGEIIDEPVKIKDDLCDAVRYAIYTRHKFEERIQGRRLTSEDIEKIEREYREIQNAGL